MRRAVLSLRQRDKFLLLRRRLARPVDEELAANENGRCGKVALVTGVLFVASGLVIVAQLKQREREKKKDRHRKRLHYIYACKGDYIRRISLTFHCFFLFGV